LARLLPKPGRWMETLKQILAFPMYLSAVWLVWVLALAGLASLYAVARVAPPVRTAAADGGSVAFSAAKLQSLRDTGTPVFVDIGADWCVTCKANEYAVLDTTGFRNLLARTGAIYMKGDWTDVDPEIGAYLRTFHSPGVPLYVVYPRGGGAGHALPTVLTASLVRAALVHADKGLAAR
jgi:thiol:disulfide interchange protein DsbD